METIVQSLGNVEAGSIAIPTGCYLREIIQIETAGNKVVGGIRYGSEVGSGDIIDTFDLDALAKERVQITSYLTPDTVYFNALEDWNGASVDIYIVLGSLT